MGGLEELERRLKEFGGEIEGSERERFREG